MIWQLFLGLLLTVLPVTELRVGLPVIVDYCLREGVSIWPWFILVIILNILVIFFIFFFLDFLHERMMSLNWYSRIIGRYIERMHKKAEKLDMKIQEVGFVALLLFVAIPLPGTGAWTGTVIAWILGLERLKSFIAISLGIIIAGFLVLLVSLGVLNLFY